MACHWTLHLPPDICMQRIAKFDCKAFIQRVIERVYSATFWYVAVFFCSNIIDCFSIAYSVYGQKSMKHKLVFIYIYGCNLVFMFWENVITSIALAIWQFMLNIKTFKSVHYRIQQLTFNIVDTAVFLTLRHNKNERLDILRNGNICQSVRS